MFLIANFSVLKSDLRLNIMKTIGLSFRCFVVKMDLTLGRASTTENCNENENGTILLFQPAVSAIKTIRKKKRADKDSIFDYLTKSLASNIEIELLEHVLTTLIENNLVINKKTPTGLSSFRIADDSLNSQSEVNNLTENNQEELNLDFNENSPLKWEYLKYEVENSQFIILKI